jgi:hypothetical protein
MGRWVAKLGQLGRPARVGKEKEKGLSRGTITYGKT